MAGASVLSVSNYLLIYVALSILTPSTSCKIYASEILNADVLIQLADMVAGSIHRYYNHKGDDWRVYRKLLQKKEQDVWEFK
jgi:hypothetical protein